MTHLDVNYVLNGWAVADKIAGNTLLIDHLHQRHDARGAKIGCSRGVCGSCTVLIDGRPAAACSVFAFQIDGRDIITIEGVGTDGPDDVQRAFAKHAAFQCGYCTPGMVLLVKSMLAHNSNPDRGTIVEWISSNVCRCTGYSQIIAAVEDIIARTVERSA